MLGFRACSMAGQTLNKFTSNSFHAHCYRHQCMHGCNVIPTTWYVNTRPSPIRVVANQVNELAWVNCTRQCTIGHTPQDEDTLQEIKCTYNNHCIIVQDVKWRQPYAHQWNNCITTARWIPTWSTSLTTSHDWSCNRYRRHKKHNKISSMSRFVPLMFISSI